MLCEEERDLQRWMGHLGAGDEVKVPGWAE